MLQFAESETDWESLNRVLDHLALGPPRGRYGADTILELLVSRNEGAEEVVPPWAEVVAGLMPVARALLQGVVVTLLEILVYRVLVKHIDLCRFLRLSLIVYRRIVCTAR